MLNRTLRLPGGMSACIVIPETPADNMKLTTTVIRRTILISPRFFRQDSSMQASTVVMVDRHREEPYSPPCMAL